MSLTIYCSSAGGSREIKQNQNEIFQYLDSKKIKYKAVDITESIAVKEEMRQRTGDPSAMPPQVFNGGVYCGDYSKFFEAREDGKADVFFKLK